jgi:hypothetical protein
VVNEIGLPAGVSPNALADGGGSPERVVDLDAVKARFGTQGFDEACAAYGMPRDRTAIRDLASTFVATELLLHGGVNVIFAQPAFTGRPDRQFDTHEDDGGVEARAIMGPITPFLATFLERALVLPGRNVVTLLVGEFSRTIPKSDHEPGGTATVIGKYVRTGTAAPQGRDGSSPMDAPPPEGLWAYVASAMRVSGAPFGRNPNPELLA